MKHMLQCLEEQQARREILEDLAFEIPKIRERVLALCLDDKERIDCIEFLLSETSHKGTIHQIRELVNDPKWDDKV